MLSKTTANQQVVREACGDRSPLIQQQNLFDMDASFADVVSEAEAVEEMQKGGRKDER